MNSCKYMNVPIVSKRTILATSNYEVGKCYLFTPLLQFTHCFNQPDRKRADSLQAQLRLCKHYHKKLYMMRPTHTVWSRRNAIMALPADLLVGTVVAHLSKHPGVSHTRIHPSFSGQTIMRFILLMIMMWCDIGKLRFWPLMMRWCMIVIRYNGMTRRFDAGRGSGVALALALESFESPTMSLAFLLRRMTTKISRFRILGFRATNTKWLQWQSKKWCDSGMVNILSIIKSLLYNLEQFKVHSS